MKSTSKSYFISAFSKNESMNENVKRHHELGKKFHELGLEKTDVIGMFKGNVELSWCVSSNEKTEGLILELLKMYTQECAMIVHGADQTAEILYPNGSKERIGTMVNLGPEEGQLRGRDYSFVNGNFYVVE